MPGRRPAVPCRALRPPRARSRAALHAARRRRPDASAVPIADRSRSATPPRPPRRPTTSGSRPVEPRGRRDGGATCARRSRPCWTAARRRGRAARGRRPEAASVRPAAGAGPARARRCPPKRSMRPGMRSAYRVRRAGPVTATRATAARPISAVSGLRSIASSRSEPNHQPPSTSPTASSANRPRGAPPPRQRRRAASAGTTQLCAPRGVGARDSGAEARQQQVRNVE